MCINVLHHVFFSSVTVSFNFCQNELLVNFQLPSAFCLIELRQMDCYPAEFVSFLPFPGLQRAADSGGMLEQAGRQAAVQAFWE